MDGFVDLFEVLWQQFRWDIVGAFVIAIAALLLPFCSPFVVWLFTCCYPTVALLLTGC